MAKKYKFKKDLKIDIRLCQPESLLFMQDCLLNDKNFSGKNKHNGYIDVDDSLMAFNESWLIEIKDEVTPADKWIEKNIPAKFLFAGVTELFFKCFNDSAKNEALKYKPLVETCEIVLSEYAHYRNNPHVEILAGVDPYNYIKLRVELEKLNKTN